MASTGNAAANAYYEARLPANIRPPRGSPLMAAFIRRKYAAKEWAGPGPWPPAEEPEAEVAETAIEQQQQQQQEQGVRRGGSVPDSNGDAPAASAAEGAAQAAAAAAAQHIDLICLDDEPAPAPAVANGGPAKRRAGKLRLSC